MAQKCGSATNAIAGKDTIADAYNAVVAMNDSPSAALLLPSGNEKSAQIPA